MWGRLQDFQRRFPQAMLDVVCHSYGSWLVWHAIRLSTRWTPILRIRRLILVASVLREDDPLEPVRDGRIAQVMNHYSRNDWVVLLAPPPFGRAGCHGFRHPSAAVTNVGDWRLGHTDYWTDARFLTTLLQELT